MASSSRRSGSLRNLVLLLLGGTIAGVVVRYWDKRQALRNPIDTVIDGIRLRRESLLDITDPDQPVQETVVVAEFVGDDDDEDFEPDIELTDDVSWLDRPDPASLGETVDGDDPDEWLRKQTEAEKAAAADDDENLSEPDPDSASGTSTLLEEPPEDLSADALAESEAVETVIEEMLAEAETVAGVDGDVDEAIEPLVEAAESSDPKWVAPVQGECPLTHQIKARFATGRYHEPGTKSYPRVVPDCCYATVEEAEADGFSKSRW